MAPPLQKLALLAFWRECMFGVLHLIENTLLWRVNDLSIWLLAGMGGRPFEDFEALEVSLVKLFCCWLRKEEFVEKLVELLRWLFNTWPSDDDPRF